MTNSIASALERRPRQPRGSMACSVALGLATAFFVSCADDEDSPSSVGGSGGEGGEITAGGASGGVPGGEPVGEAGAGGTAAPITASGPSRGAPIALTPDDARAVVVNRDAGSVSVVALEYPAGEAPTATKLVELD